MNDPNILALVWIGVAVVFAIVEGVTTGLTSIWFAGGALAAALTAIVTDNIYIQAAVFILISVVLLIATRPLVKKHINNKVEKTNVDALTGMKGIVIAAISPNETGAVRADGKVWSATADCEIGPGSEVEITGIKGVTVSVAKIK